MTLHPWGRTQSEVQRSNLNNFRSVKFDVIVLIVEAKQATPEAEVQRRG